MDTGQEIDRKGSSARLHVLLARDAAKAVVFRRGPTRQVASYLWDRASDTFSLGQWLIGRIYERRADLSPDGRHLIYFARDARWHSETGGSWTAVSRAPWLRAVTLWAKGDCWQGGGLFVDGQRYWLNGCHRGLLLDDSDLSCVADPPSGGFGAECLSVYYPRLLRDGWKLAEPINRAGWIDRFEKPLAHGWTLVKLAHRSANPPPGRGCYWDEHLLLHAGSDTVLAYPDWEWAESDPAGIIYAEHGCLFRRPITTDGPGAPALLRDFNGDHFEARAAPY